MHRRSFITLGGGSIVAALGGIRILSPRVDAVHRLRSTNPFPLVLHNNRAVPTTAFVAVERNGALLGDEMIDLAPDDSAQLIAIERAGEYNVVVESEEMIAEKDVWIGWEYLADCNANYFFVFLYDKSIDIMFTRTDQGCGELLWKSGGW